MRSCRKNRQHIVASYQIQGSALVIPLHVLRAEIGHGGMLQTLVLRYSRTLLAHTAQGVLCHASHSLEERMCRWMLTVADRIGADEFDITQEFIATMLGARRSTVTMVAGTFCTAGLLSATHSDVCVLWHSSSLQGITTRTARSHHVSARDGVNTFQSSDHLDIVPRHRGPARSTADYPGIVGEGSAYGRGTA